MKILKKFLPETQFAKNIITLISGTSIAQIIPIAASPLITRLYNPIYFGEFALFSALIAILSIPATGRYEPAILLPKNEKNSKNIVALSLIIAMATCLIISILLLIFQNRIIKILPVYFTEFSHLNICYIYLIPLSIFLNAIIQTFSLWLNLKKQFVLLSISRVYAASLTTFTQIAIGFYGNTLKPIGLITGFIAGQMIYAVFLSKSFFRYGDLKSIKLVKMFVLAKKYIKFPKFDILASLFNTASMQITNILFNIFFSPIIAGYYFLARRITGAPIAFVSSSILEVFKQKAAAQYKKKGNAKQIFIKTFKLLISLSIIPALIMFLYAKQIFSLVFGSNWVTAGTYVSLLTPMFFFRFIASPLSFMFYIGEKQKANMYGNFIILLLTVSAFCIFTKPLQLIKFLSFSLSVVYIVYLYLSAKIAKVF